MDKIYPDVPVTKNSPSAPVTTSFVEVSERDLDFLFAEEIECNPAFSTWLLRRSGSPGRNWEDIIRIGRSVTTALGETDLLVVHQEPDGGQRAIMIENKIAASFTPFQSERYRRRGREGVAAGEWASFRTVLLAPAHYCDSIDLPDFDEVIAYEEVLEFMGTLPPNPRHAFKCRILAAALGKAKQPYVKKPDFHMSQFFTELRRYAEAQFPDLPIPPDKAARGAVSTWLMLPMGSILGASRLTLEIKPYGGNVDLRFTSLRLAELRSIVKGRLPDGAETVAAKKSSAIRFMHAPMDVRRPFSGQEHLAWPLIESAHKLWVFVQEDRQHIETALAQNSL